MTVQEQVFSALNNARDNGYMNPLPPLDEIVDDLLSYDADLEAYLREELVPHVEAWILENNVA